MKIDRYKCDQCGFESKPFAGWRHDSNGDFCCEECAITFQRNMKPCSYCSGKIKDVYKITNIFGDGQIITKNNVDIINLEDTLFCSIKCLTDYITCEYKGE